MAVQVISDADRLEIRRLYKTNLFNTRQLAAKFSTSQHQILGVVADLVNQRPGRPDYSIPPPQGHRYLPTVLVSQRVRIGRRLWWLGIPQKCVEPGCGGTQQINRADIADGDVSCHLCGRAVAVVRREVV